MKVVILCGGYGTRIRDVSADIPKPMIPVGGLPILWHIMKYYSSFGFSDFILCLGYKGHVIKDFFLNYRARTSDFSITLGESGGIEYHTDHAETKWRITLAETGLETMTGGRIARIEHYLRKDEDFMLTYGDGLSNIDLGKLLEYHRSHRKIATVSGVRPPGRFGELRAEGDGTIIEFNEKPQATAGLINGGYFVLRQEIFKYLPNRESLVFEQEPMRSLVRDRNLMVYEHDGFWQPMDTYRDYSYLNSIYAKGEALWKKW